MNEIKKIKLESMDRDYIQFLHFELTSYKDILSHILLEKTKGYNYSIENYEHFMNEYKEANIKYSLVMSEMINKYAPEYHGNSEYLANCNFENCEMIIYKREEV